jgi:glycosyltransferase involved in cell wall biosynthesis
LKQLSATIITLDEEEKIGNALASLEGLCDEIVVVDSYSSDDTPRICERFGCRFIQQEWLGYRQQKQLAVDLTTKPWVLSLDADEELSPSLRAELFQWKSRPDDERVGFLLPRIAFFMGRWILHTTWHPDWQLRLFQKSAGRWQGGRVHESVKVSGPIGRMANPIRHYTYSSISEYLAQLDKFSSLAAADHLDRSRGSGWAYLVFYPPLVFAKNFILKAGFLDGLPGFVVSLLAATSTFFKYLKVEELRASQEEEPSHQ